MSSDNKRKGGLQGRPNPAQRRGGEAHPLAKQAGIDRDSRLVPVSAIEPDPNQPRRHFDQDALAQLANSIKEQGILQPLLVLEKGQKYQLIAGERRLRAAQKAGISTVPVRLITDPSKVREIQLVENLQREELPLMDEARALKELQDTLGASGRELAQAIGKDKNYVHRRLQVLDFPDDIQAMLEQAPQLFSKAAAIAKIADPHRRAKHIQRLLGGDDTDTSSVPAARGRPVDPFKFRTKQSGAFDLVVKYRPGQVDRTALIERLQSIIDELKNNS